MLCSILWKSEVMIKTVKTVFLFCGNCRIMSQHRTRIPINPTILVEFVVYGDPPIHVVEESGYGKCVENVHDESTSSGKIH